MQHSLLVYTLSSFEYTRWQKTTTCKRDRAKESEYQKGRRWENMKMTLSSVFQGLLSLFLCLKGRQTRMLHLLLRRGACSITEATNAPSHLEGNLQRMFCSCGTILQLSAIFWQMFKFKIQKSCCLTTVWNAASGWNRPITNSRCQELFFGCLFYRFGFRLRAVHQSVFVIPAHHLAVRFLHRVIYHHLFLVTSPP